jgi:hypothetical protein
MALAATVQGARHIAQQITWQERDSNNNLSPVDLSGSTITAHKKSKDGTVVQCDGNFSLETDGTDGIFNWTYGTIDVGTAGNFEVQFIATFGDSTTDKTIVESWTVHEAFDE